MVKLLLVNLLARVVLLAVGTSAFAAEPAFKAADLRGVFVSEGYSVEPLIEWPWLSPPHSSFRALDSRTQQVLVIEVYADSATALSASSRAGGYGPSVSFQNVVIRETSDAMLANAATAELEAEMLGTPQTVTVAAPPRSVDPAVVGLLFNHIEIAL